MVRLYTDGSYQMLDNGPCVSYAWVVIDDTLPEYAQRIRTGKGVITNDAWTVSRNVAGELEAVIDGLDYLDDNGFKEVVVCHDYLGIAKWITGEWETKAELTKMYKRFVNRLQRTGMMIRFEHVKAHTGDRWNEYVDRMAKEAMEIL